MKEKIYTIPVMDAFAQDCECPLCLLEEKLEKEYVDYFLGPALMEPDCRINTNKNGFCRRHFEQLYNRQENRLGLALITDTHLREKIQKIKETARPLINGNAADNEASSSRHVFAALKLSSKGKTGEDTAEKILEILEDIGKRCSICEKLGYTMERYLDVIMYLWSKEADFRNVFSEKKGFCLIHLKQLIAASVKYLNAHDRRKFLGILMQQQIENLERIEKELDWFTKKFDYRFNDAPWGNSRDALPRSIQKLKGFCNLK